MARLVLVFVMGLGIASWARAEEPIVLKPGPGRDKVELHCAVCHSLEYIEMNSKFLTRAQWQKEVRKMIEAFGAPIDRTDADQITDYLARTYGGT